MLSDREILQNKELNNIIIFPFNEHQLGPNSYDVTIGEFYYKQNKNPPDILSFENKETYMEFWDLNPAKEHYGVHKAEEIEDNLYEKYGFKIGDKVIKIPPGDTILAHTNEFIGGQNVITTEMKARSTVGRSCITVCSCAGLGDIGYINRWTMEIKNQGRSTVFIKVGAKLAQICFFHTGECDRNYHTRGQYQSSDNLDVLQSSWSPIMMLPSFAK
jgi:dCTP deaminase